MIKNMKTWWNKTFGEKKQATISIPITVGTQVEIKHRLLSAEEVAHMQGLKITCYGAGGGGGSKANDHKES